MDGWLTGATRMRIRAIAAIGPIVGVLLLTGCADKSATPFVKPLDEPTGSAPAGTDPVGRPPVPPTGRESTNTPTPRTSAQAQGLAVTLALAPTDWGSEYVRQNTYEFAGETWTDFGPTCAQRTVSIPATVVGQWTRQVQIDNAAATAVTFSGGTGAIVHRDEAGARGQMADSRATGDRCTTRTYTDGTRAECVPVAAPPAFAGVDEAYVEEGVMYPRSSATKPEGTGGPYPYTMVYLRRGDVVLTAYLTGPTPDKAQEAREGAARAARLMLDRLPGS